MYIAFIQPILLFIFAAAIGGLWAWRKQNGQIACMAAGFALFGLGLAIQISQIPAASVDNAVASAIAYSAGAVAFSLGVLERVHRRRAGAVLVGMGIAIVVGIWYFAAIDYHLVARVYILNFGLGAIMLVATWFARSLARGSRTDKLLFWLVLVLALHFFPRTVLTAGSIGSSDPADFSQTAFWNATTFAFAVLGLITGIGVIVTTMGDALSEAQKERDTDPLTGLANRRGLESEMQALMADRASRPISLIVCDLDNFKSVNDRYGHAAGDDVLSAFAHTLRANTRQGDLVARQGGEEFVAILPRLDAEKALAFAERLRLAVAATGFDEIATGLSVTASLGVVQLRDGEDLDGALKRADELLYAAKHNGRNRTYAEGIGPVGRNRKRKA